MDDVDDLHRIFSEPKNRKFFHEESLPRERAVDIVKKSELRHEENGIYFWAPVLKETGQMFGFIGLNIFDYEVPFEPKVEVGWTVDYPLAGKGLATEAAKASLKYGFEKLGYDEIVAITAIPNTPSRRVMEKCGMKLDPSGNFMHPKVPKDHPMAEHVLYRLKKHESTL